MSKELKEFAIQLIHMKGAARHVDLVDALEQSFDTPSDIHRILSEIAQDNLVKRISYKIPGSIQERFLYFPLGTRIE